MIDILTGTAFDAPKRLNHREDEVALEFPPSVSSRARGLLALKAQNWGAAGKHGPTVTIVDGEVYTYEGRVVSRSNFSRIDDYFEIPAGCVTMTYRWAISGAYYDVPTPVIAFYLEDKTYVDYWSFNQSGGARTIPLASHPTYRMIRFCFKSSDMDDCFVRDDTNGIYLWKGANVK